MKLFGGKSFHVDQQACTMVYSIKKDLARLFSVLKEIISRFENCERHDKQFKVNAFLLHFLINIHTLDYPD